MCYITMDRPRADLGEGKPAASAAVRRSDLTPRLRKYFMNFKMLITLFPHSEYHLKFKGDSSHSASSASLGVRSYC